MVDQCPFLFEAWAQVENNTFLFQQHFKATCDFLPPPTRVCFPPFEQLIRQQMVQLQESILKRLHHHTFYRMFSDGTFETHCAWILSCFGLGVGGWLTPRPIFLTFQLSSPIVFHNISYVTWTTSSLNCKHPSTCVHTSHQPYGYPPFTLCSWQRTHWNPWCNSWHLCCHCTEC